MKANSDPIAGYLVLASRGEPDGRLRVREFTVGIVSAEDAAGAVIAAFPELDDGFHVEASIGLTRENLASLGVALGQILDGAETVE